MANKINVDDMRWLKHRISGRVLQWTPILANHPDMIECDARGNVKDLSPRKAESFVIKDGEKETTVSPMRVAAGMTLDQMKDNPVVPGPDVSDLSLKERIEACTKDAEVIDLGARFDIGFAAGMTLDQMKASLIDELTKQKIIKAAKKRVAKAKKRKAAPPAAPANA